MQPRRNQSEDSRPNTPRFDQRTDRSEQNYSDLPEHDLEARNRFNNNPYTDEDYGSNASERNDWNARAARSDYSSYSDNDYGNFSGIGPKGYTRSDDRLREEICDMLTRHSSVDASDIEVEVKNGEVTLKGTVPDRRMKYLAEEVADQSHGLKDIHNQLKLKKADNNQSF